MTVHSIPRSTTASNKARGSFAGGTLVCKCKDQPVKVGIKGDVAHNHACGCTKCWKPEGAIFSVVAVVPRQNVTVLENGDKLQIVDAVGGDPALRLQGLRHAHVRPHREQGPSVLRPRLHPPRTVPGSRARQAPQFAAFVSSVIESGVKPEQMAGIRARLKELGLEPYDCLSPALMDAIATHVAKAKAA